VSLSGGVMGEWGDEEESTTASDNEDADEETATGNDDDITTDSLLCSTFSNIYTKKNNEYFKSLPGSEFLEFFVVVVVVFTLHELTNKFTVFCSHPSRFFIFFFYIYIYIYII
jgi:hypothetical protein